MSAVILSNNLSTLRGHKTITMFNFSAKLATGDIKIETVNRITQANLDPEMLVFAADAASAQIARMFDPNLQLKFEEFPKNIQSQINALTKGCRDILSGLPFTANIGFNPRGEGRVVTTFAIQSSSRADVIYQPSIYDCQCEGHQHHGVCKHRLVRNVFDVYVDILSAQQELQTRYAKFGVELTVVKYEPKPKLEVIGDAEMKALFAQMGFDLLDEPNARSH